MLLFIIAGLKSARKRGSTGLTLDFCQPEKFYGWALIRVAHISHWHRVHEVNTAAELKSSRPVLDLVPCKSFKRKLLFSSFILRVIILLSRRMVWTHEVPPGTEWVQTIPSFSKINHELLLNEEMNFFSCLKNLVCGNMKQNEEKCIIWIFHQHVQIPPKGITFTNLTIWA